MIKYKNEYEYLIHLIKCAIHGQQPDEKPTILSFEKVYEYGEIHEVANIAFVSIQKLKNKPDDDLYLKWKTNFAFSIQRHANQIDARNKIVSTLSNAGIRTLEVQGTVIKTLYPNPVWRMMSDIDFIIDKDSFSKAEMLMQKLGYKITTQRSECIVAYAANGIAVDLHSDFFEPTSICYGAIEEAFSLAVPTDEGLTYKVSDTVFYLYNMLHIIKHYLHCGVGIRRILDIYILNQKLIENVNTEYVNNILEKYNFSEIANKLNKIAYVLFDSSSILDTSILDDLQTIYSSGNHGTIQILLNNEYRMANNKNKFLFKLNKIICKLFPEKETIYKTYSYCNKYKYPIVLCWIHRFFYLLLTPKKIINSIKYIFEIITTKIN